MPPVLHVIQEKNAGKREVSTTHSDGYRVIIMNFDQTIEKYHKALEEFNKGRPEFVLDLFSERDDVSLANPLGPSVRGRKRVVKTAARAATYFSDCQSARFENIAKVVTPDLAFIAENERYKVRVGGRQDFSMVALRTTTVFRPEEGIWKIVHRHADSVVSKRPAESLIQH